MRLITSTVRNITLGLVGSKRTAKEKKRNLRLMVRESCENTGKKIPRELESGVVEGSVQR